MARKTTPKRGEPFVYRGKRLKVDRIEGTVLVATNPKTKRSVTVSLAEVDWVEEAEAWAVPALLNPRGEAPVQESPPVGEAEGEEG